MGRPHPYRKREAVICPPAARDFESVEDFRTAWETEMVPWMDRLRAHADGRAITPRETGHDRAVAEMIAELAEKVAVGRRRPLAERVPEVSMDEIRARQQS